jgi:hypothetical protein
MPKKVSRTLSLFLNDNLEADSSLTITIFHSGITKH